MKKDTKKDRKKAPEGQADFLARLGAIARPPGPVIKAGSGADDADGFAAHDAANPWIWEGFVDLARERIRQGFRHYGARDIVAVLRYAFAVPGDDGSGYKINNNWSPWYARKFDAEFPEHKGFFHHRAARADRRKAKPA